MAENVAQKWCYSFMQNDEPRPGAHYVNHATANKKVAHRHHSMRRKERRIFRLLLY